MQGNKPTNSELANDTPDVRPTVQPRPSMLNYGAVPTGLDKKINRIEIYSTKRKRGHFWQPKRIIHTLALTDKGVYEIFPPDHKPHPPLFGDYKGASSK